MINRIFILLLTVFVGGHLAAQQRMTLPPYRQYTLRDGLSQMQVTCLFQDSRGYLWIGTKGGLNCFNGERFTSYTQKKFPEMANEYINQVCEDSRGRIWASTPTGIFRFDGSSLHFFRVDANPIPWIAADDKGRVWFAHAKFSETTFNIRYIEDDSIKTFLIDQRKRLSTPQIQLYFLKEEKKFLMAYDSLLYRIDGHQLQLLDDQCAFAFANLVQDKEHFYYFEGFQPDHNGEGIARNFDVKEYSKGKIKRLASVRNGQYLGKPQITRSIPFSTTGIQIHPFLLTPDSVSYSAFEGMQINQVMADQEDNFWVGSEDGLYQLFGNAFTAYSREYLPQVWAVTEDKNKDLWFSSFFFGLSKLKQGQLTRYPNYFKEKVAFAYFHPVMDKRGRLFFPNSYGLLMVDGQRFDQQGDVFNISAYYDPERDLVWGGRKKGADVFNSKRQKVRAIDEHSGLEVGNNVITIGKDTSGQYWLGGGAGLARYNWESNKVKNYQPGNHQIGVYTQRTDYTGRTWFGTKDGLYWYNAKTDSHCKMEREELSDVVSLLEPIDSSWLIVSQPSGIYLLDLQAYYKKAVIRLYLFNEKNGFQGIEPGQDGAFTDSKGQVWITTSTELMKLDPRKLKPGKDYLGVRIDQLNGRKLSFSSPEAVLPPNENSSVVTFDAIGFNRPNPVQYSWKIGSDTTWSVWQEENYAVISGLNDGLTQIMVRARIKGLPSTATAQANIGIQVRMALYRQPWFFPVLFILISFVGTGFLLMALLQLKKSNREATIFQLQAIQSQMNPHFIFNVLASLQTMILQANISKANDYLVKLADLIRSFLESSLKTGSIHLPGHRQGLVSISSELKLLNQYIEFQQLIHPEKIEYQLVMDEDFDISQEILPPMLLQPFVENAIRHGILPKKGKGLIELILERKDRRTQITIRDDGIGIQQAEKMLHQSPLRYTSRGKELTVQRIRLLNQLGFKIDIHTESNEGGTTIKIIIY